MDTAEKSKDAPGTHREYLSELLWNQIWQSANFVSKAVFLLLLTPLMVKNWGADGFGLFGLSSSLLVSMALTDGGVRSLTRLRLTEAIRNSDEAEFRRALGEGLFTFATVLILVVLAAIGLAAAGWMQSILQLPAGGSLVLLTTVISTGVSMLTFLALEPLAARGKLSTLKAANTWGALLAIPVCGAAVWWHGPVLAVVLLYSLCTITPNLILILRAGIPSQFPSGREWHCTPGVFFRTLRSGAWYYATTIALVIKTHALTFVVSALAGPAEAGIFYFMLRLTEIIGNLGATASETSLASLAATENPAERGQKFNHCWQYVALFCLPGALVFGAQGNWLLHLWFPRQGLVWMAGLGMAVFGLAGAFSRVVVNASMGLRLIKMAGLANLAEAATNVIGAVIGYRLAGLPGVMLGGCLGVLAMLPPAKNIAALCGESFSGAFIRPLSSLAIGLGIMAVTQAGAAWTHSLILKFAAIALAGVIVLIQLRRLHR
jgi:O-antigen/teichoic acid export membrane protein